MRQFATFYIGDERFGIDIRLVKEINRHLEITDVAGLPDYVRGLLNLRGRIVTVLDLVSLLSRKRCIIKSSTRCVVMKTMEELRSYQEAGMINDSTGPDVVGFLVDRVGDIIVVDDGDIGPPPASVNGQEDRFFSGVLQLEDGLLLTLSAREVLAG